MSKIDKLQITNIGPWKNISINFKRHNIIKGEDGSGKSSIIHALDLGLTGTMPERPYGMYVNKDSNIGTVKIDVDTEKHVRNTERTLDKNSNKVSYVMIQQSKLMEQLNINKDIIKACLYTSYFTEESTSTSKANIINSIASTNISKDKLLEIVPENIKSYVEEKFDNIQPSSSKKTKIDALIKIARDDMKTSKAIVKQQQEQLNKLTTEMKIYEGIKETNIDKNTLERTNKVMELQNDISHIQSTIEDIQNEEKQFTLKRQTAKEDIDQKLKSQTDYNTLDDIPEYNESKRDEIRDKISVNEGRLKLYKKLAKDGKCSVCNSTLTNRDFDSEIEEVNNEIDSLREEFSNLTIIKKLNEYKKFIDTIDAKIEGIKSKISANQDKIQEKESEVNKLKDKGILTKEGIENVERSRKLNELKKSKERCNSIIESSHEKTQKMKEVTDFFKDRTNWEEIVLGDKLDEYKKLALKSLKALLPKYEDDISINNQCDINIKDISYQTLSVSEKYRVGIALQIAVASINKSPILVIDGTNIVSAESKSYDAILNSIKDNKDIGTIIFTTSSLELPDKKLNIINTKQLENNNKEDKKE